MRRIICNYSITASWVLFLFAGAIKAEAAVTMAGDIAFVGFNPGDAGGGVAGDGFAWVALVDIGAGEIIQFTDDETDGSGALIGSEGTMTWTASGAVTVGTVVEISEDSGSASTGLVAESGSFDLSTSGDGIIAYLGALGTPTTFVSIINTAGPLPDDANPNINGTGLTYGTNAVDFSASPNDDFYEYSGPTDFAGPPFGTADVLATINDPSNWSIDTTGGASAAGDGDGIDGPYDTGVGEGSFVIPEPSGAVFVMLGLFGVSLIRRRKSFFRLK